MPEYLLEEKSLIHQNMLTLVWQSNHKEGHILFKTSGIKNIQNNASLVYVCKKDLKDMIHTEY